MYPEKFHKHMQIFTPIIYVCKYVYEYAHTNIHRLIGIFGVDSERDP